MKTHPSEEGYPGEWWGRCDRCNTKIERWRGENDVTCDKCGANYNCFGQRLRDDLRTRINISDTIIGEQFEIGDLEGDEMSYQDW